MLELNRTSVRFLLLCALLWQAYQVSVDHGRVASAVKDNPFADAWSSVQQHYAPKPKSVARRIWEWWTPKSFHQEPEDESVTGQMVVGMCMFGYYPIKLVISFSKPQARPFICVMACIITDITLLAMLATNRYPGKSSVSLVEKEGADSWDDAEVAHSETSDVTAASLGLGDAFTRSEVMSYEEVARFGVDPFCKVKVIDWPNKKTGKSVRHAIKVINYKELCNFGENFWNVYINKFLLADRMKKFSCNEAAALNALYKKTFISGPNCFKTVKGTLFCVSSLTGYQSLDKLLSTQGALKYNVVRFVSSQVAHVILIAHASGHVIGDINPHSVYIDGEGSVHVITNAMLCRDGATTATPNEDWMNLGYIILSMFAGKNLNTDKLAADKMLREKLEPCKPYTLVIKSLLEAREQSSESVDAKIEASEFLGKAKFVQRRGDAEEEGVESMELMGDLLSDGHAELFASNIDAY